MHILLQFAEAKLDEAVTAFKRSDTPRDWVELKAAMMRYQQAFQICRDPKQADLDLDAALLGRLQAGSWIEMLRDCGEPVGDE